MPSSVERDHLVKEFCKNTGASHTHAQDVLSRNKWNLPNSYNEVQQMLASKHRASTMPPPPPYPHTQPTRPAPSRGGMEGGVGPAVSLDARGVRPPLRHVGQPVTTGSRPHIQQVEGLKVALPPVAMSTERVIPVHVEGGFTTYQAQSTVAPSSSMARVTLDEKVFPSQPGMVAPRESGGSHKAFSADPVSATQPAPAPAPAPAPGPAPHGLDSYPRLKRGFSSITENEVLVSAARSVVLQDIQEDSHAHMFMTFMLPDLTSHPEPFRAFLMKELIESSTLHSLEAAGRLNWWVQEGLCQRLIPMATTGDGNCLLHAASLSMWGIHDRLLTLRNALHHSLTSSVYKHNLYRRWRWQQTLVNQQSGLVFSEAEWQAEWDNILRLASPSPRSGPDSTVNINSCCDNPITSSSSASDSVVYESLEEFHVFVLAHVLQRPIIVVADTILHDANGEALAPIPFGGIYLPLECHRDECYTSPLLLTYDAAHFSALVPMQHSQSSDYLSVPLAIPVVDPQLQLLPLHFCHDPGPKFDWSSLTNQDTAAEPCQQDKLNLLKAYMDILHLPLSSHITSSGQPVEDWGGVNSKDRKKDGKQNAVAKQFGSFGKSMGKKLKNLSNNLAPHKAGKGVDGGEKGQNMSVGGSLTHSTKVITALATTTGGGENEESVHCAKLLCESQDTRDVFINNYLHDAQRRYQQEQELKRQRGEEQRPRGAPPQTLAALSQSRTCRTAGCRNVALPDISLCDLCASQNQWQQGGTLDRSRSKGQGQGQTQTQIQGQQFSYNTFPGRHKAPTGLPHATATSDEIYHCGKSKFYTPTNPAPTPADSRLQVLRQEDRQQSLSTGNVTRAPPAPRPRSPSPDYDRLNYGKEANPNCATPGCTFYGSKDTGNLCSGCHRKQAQQAHLAKPEKTTRL